MTLPHQTMLVTGGAGFIGSNFVAYLRKQRPEMRVINLDKFTYAASLDNLKDVANDPDHILVKGDINDHALVGNLFAQYDIRGVVHFAAESHVDNSISGPRVFFETNVLGTQTLLDAARIAWMDAPHHVKAGYETCRFHHVSTDEVYGTLGETGKFTEQTPYAPNSPYSASKAGSDFVARSYAHTYGMNVVVTNCSNNYGPHQHDEKLMPTVIRNALACKPIPIYGTGKNVRDWLFVEDHCKGILTVFEQGIAEETYNIGGESEQNNLDIAAQICALLDELAPRADGTPYAKQLQFVQDRPGHDMRYAIDIDKIRKTLGWEPAESFPSGLRKTVQWYVQKYQTK